METRLSKQKASCLAQRLRFDNYWVVDRVGTGGGLMLLWGENLKIEVLSWSVGHITGRVSGDGFTPWFITGFYRNLDQSKRVHSWELLRKIRDMCLGPWLCIGDFNEILGNHERIGETEEVLLLWIDLRMFWMIAI